MSRLNVRRLVIGGGLTIVAAGTFAFGLAASDMFRPLPVVVHGGNASKGATELPRRFAATDMPAEPHAKVRSVASAETLAKSAGGEGSAEAPVPMPGPIAMAPPPASPDLVSEQKAAPAEVPALSPAQTAPTVAVPPETPAAERRLGFLGDVEELWDAVAAIDRTGGEAAKSLDTALARLAANRSDPAVWSDLVDVLARAGQRVAAVTIANRGMMAARGQPNGEALTRLTRQLAQMELAQPQPETARAAAVPQKTSQGPNTPPPTAQSLDVNTATSSEKLSDALDVALRDNAAADALAILQQMADGSIRRGDFTAAQKAYNNALAIAHTRQMTEARADQYANLGRMFWKKGDKGEAVAYWRAARDQYEQFEVPAKVADMNTLLLQASSTAGSSPSRPTQSGKKTSSIIELR